VSVREPTGLVPPPCVAPAQGLDRLRPANPTAAELVSFGGITLPEARALLDDIAETRARDKANGLRSCRVCGCTDNAACWGGCRWTFDDLCSRCPPAA
jgi:hypothetical protein